jgi:predicted Zn-dependent protease
MMTRPSLQRLAWVAAVIVVLAGAVRSALRVPEWRSTETIFAALLRDRPDSFRAHWIDARRLRTAGDVAGAVAAYDRAVSIWPHGPQLGVEAAAFAVEAGDLRAAHRIAARSSEVRASDIAVQRLRAAIALDVADTVTARSAIASGLAIAPDDPLLRTMQTSLETGEVP